MWFPTWVTEFRTFFENYPDVNFPPWSNETRREPSATTERWATRFWCGKKDFHASRATESTHSRVTNFKIFTQIVYPTVPWHDCYHRIGRTQRADGACTVPQSVQTTQHAVGRSARILTLSGRSSSTLRPLFAFFLRFSSDFLPPRSPLFFSTLEPQTVPYDLHFLFTVLLISYRSNLGVSISTTRDVASVAANYGLPAECNNFHPLFFTRFLRLFLNKHANTKTKVSLPFTKGKSFLSQALDENTIAVITWYFLSSKSIEYRLHLRLERNTKFDARRRPGVGSWEVFVVLWNSMTPRHPVRRYCMCSLTKELKNVNSSHLMIGSAVGILNVSFLLKAKV